MLPDVFKTKQIFKKQSKSSIVELLCPHFSIRSLGSAATNMCMVASGSVDAYYEIGMHCWDIAAGDLIIQEAGGVVIDISGDICL